MPIYHQSVNEIDSSESRYKNVLFRNNNIIVPYVNLAISNHPLHLEGKEMKYIDYAYMVFKDILYLSVYISGHRYLIIGEESEDEFGDSVLYFGGDYWDAEKKVFNDMRIICKESYLQTLYSSNISEKMWIPFDTPVYKKNMNLREVEDFFSHKYMPEEIKVLITVTS